MSSFIPKTRRYLASITVASILLILVGYYYLVYVPQAGNAIEETNFKSLRQMSKNIDEKIRNYRIIAKSRAQQINDSINSNVKIKVSAVKSKARNPKHSKLSEKGKVKLSKPLIIRLDTLFREIGR